MFYIAIFITILFLNVINCHYCKNEREVNGAVAFLKHTSSKKYNILTKPETQLLGQNALGIDKALEISVKLYSAVELDSVTIGVSLQNSFAQQMWIPRPFGPFGAFAHDPFDVLCMDQTQPRSCDFIGRTRKTDQLRPKNFLSLNASTSLNDSAILNEMYDLNNCLKFTVALKHEPSIALFGDKHALGSALQRFNRYSRPTSQVYLVSETLYIELNEPFISLQESAAQNNQAADVKHGRIQSLYSNALDGHVIDMLESSPSVTASSGFFLTFEKHTCSETERNQLVTAVDALKRMLLSVQRTLIEDNKCGDIFQALFVGKDIDAQERLAEIHKYVSRKFTKLQSEAKHIHFICHSSKDIDYYRTCHETVAFVYSKRSHNEIHLCSSFFSLQRSKTPMLDNQPGTLLHELTHFKRFVGTKDHSSGFWKSLELARRDAKSALENAYNYEYYGEILFAKGDTG